MKLLLVVVALLSLPVVANQKVVYGKDGRVEVSPASSKWKKFFCSHWCSYIINDDSWGSRMKGYQPYSKSLRFFGNVDKDCIGGLWDLDNSDSDIIITKSYKDWRVLKNRGFQVIWFQNEGMIPDLKLLKGFKHRTFTILFDNDKAGIKAAIHVRDEIIDLKNKSHETEYLTFITTMITSFDSRASLCFSDADFLLKVNELLKVQGFIDGMPMGDYLKLKRFQLSKQNVVTSE